MSLQVFQVAYVFPRSGGPMPYAKTTVKFSAFANTNSNGQAGSTAQQNVNAAHHWYQNCLVKDAAGGVYWYLEAFEQEKNPDGSWAVDSQGRPVFPPDGQFVRGTTPTDIQTPGTNDITPQLPKGLDPQAGGLTAVLLIKDDGAATISQQMTLLQTSTGATLYTSPWVVVADIGETSGTSGHWYDKLTAAAFDPGDQTGATTTFAAGASMTVEHECGVHDLVFGGMYYTQQFAPGDLTWYPTGSVPAPPVNYASAENSNLWFVLVDRDSPTAGTLPPILASVNGYTGAAYVKTTDTLDWDATGLTDDEGGIAQFGVIAHGINPAPQGAGFMVVDEQTVDKDGMVRGSVAYSDRLTAKPPDTRVGAMAEGLVLDAYIYDNAAASARGYSQPVVVTVTNALLFQGSVYQ